MASTGTKVKALDSLPEMTDVDAFYYDMFTICNINIQFLHIYCKLHKMPDSEIIEALDIMALISAGVQ